MPIRHINNGDGSVTQVDADTGQELVTFRDDDGSFTTNVLEPAAQSAAQERPKGSNAERTFARALELSPKQKVMPEQTSVTPEAPVTPFSKSLSPPAPATARPSPQLPLAQTETSGLAPEDLAERRGMRGEVQAADERANAATTQAEQDQLAARATRVDAESDRALGAYATDLELHELAKKHVLQSEEAAKADRAKPIDPGQALAGDKFFFAILANVGAALSNFGSALLGQKATQDTNVVDDLIRQSVQMQMAQKNIDIDATSRDQDYARSESARLEMRANASLEKWFESRAAVEKNPELAAQYRANAEQRDAAIKRSQMELAESEWTKEVKTRAVPKPGKKVPGPVNAETAQEQAVLEANGVTDANFRKYTKERVKSGADQVINDIAGAKDVVNKLASGQDVPGVGKWDEFATKWLNDPDGAAVQQVLGMTQAQFIHSVSGAAATDKEAERLLKVIQGPGWTPNKETITRGLNILESHARSSLDTLNTGYPGESRSYDAIGGMRKGRRTLSDEQRARRDEQLGGGPKGSTETTSEDAAQFLDETRKPRGDRSRGSHSSGRSNDRDRELLRLLD